MNATLRGENENNSNNQATPPLEGMYRDTSHSPEIPDDVFSPDANSQPLDTEKVNYSYNEDANSSPPDKQSNDYQQFYPNFPANQIEARNENGRESADFEAILKKVEQRNSQSESVFSENANVPYPPGDLEQQSLSSFTQLMSESFNTSFDLTSISENPAYMDSLKSDSPPNYPGATQESDTSGDKPAPSAPGYYPASMDPACMYYSGYWTPYSGKEYLNRLYYAQRYAPYQKSSSTSTHPYALSKAPLPSNSTSSFPGYSPALYPTSLNGSTSSFEGANPTGHKYFSSTSSLSPPDTPAATGFVSKRKSGRRKKRSQLPSANAEPHFTRVFVWDLDETSIILLSLLNGTYAGKFGQDSGSLRDIGFQMNEIIFSLVNTHFFQSQLEECDQVHFEDVAIEDNGIDLSSYDFSTDGFSLAELQTPPNHKSSTSSVTPTSTAAPCATNSSCVTGPGIGIGNRSTQDWCKKLAYRYRRIQEIYTKYGCCDLESLLGQEQYTAWYKLLCKLEGITEQWVSQARKCLLHIQATPGYTNILVSQSPLVLTLGKCLLFGLSNVFHIQNIYSANKAGKAAVFERLISRFGTKCTYVSIGHSPEDEDASKKHNFPFWRVTSQSDLIALERALQLQHL